MMNKILVLIALYISVLIGGCRGQLSEEPPIHLNPNMDNQQKSRPYGKNSFFKDKRSMRPSPEGVVAWTTKNVSDSYETGKTSKGFLRKNPEKLTEQFIRRGQERFNIYCSVCHGYTGLGNGIVIRKGFVPAPSYLDDRILSLSDGEFFSVITNGVRSMPAYAKQILVKDRWAIVSYIRALQKAGKASSKHVPVNLR